MWNRKPKPPRPIGAWKNGKTLFLIGAGGTFLILSATLASLYPIWAKEKEMRAEEAEARAFRKEHRKVLDPEWKLPEEPTKGELSALQEKVPVTAEPARLITELQKAVNDSGAEWKEFRTAENLSDLEKTKDGKEEKEDGNTSGKEENPPGEADSEGLPRLPDDSRLTPYWADLHVRGTEEQLLTLFGNLQEMKRIVSVQGWEYTQEKKAGQIRIRLAWFVYGDKDLKNLPPRPRLEVPKEEEPEPKGSEAEQHPDEETEKEENRESDPAPSEGSAEDGSENNENSGTQTP
ncbi:hypothetical protein C8P63_1272 [Melghirimyces profundicolus]|uniref:Uncharacterized protein n=1 Tax=Melghirimyces profundicolus TaxID=1242148 RepID=A0A2T6BCB6_9BACL|nr:hypothetical protein [Melghirimyces profundicolus]PTX53682.1 hypothetical protein C8P63_1272 [Melghirimyces profundicolus]